MNVGRIHPLVEDAERYGIKPDVYHGMTGQILKHTTSLGRQIYDARARYKNKKYIILPKVPHNFSVEHLIDPKTRDLPPEYTSYTEDKIHRVLGHAYGKPIRDVILTDDRRGRKYVESFFHPTARVPLGRIIGFELFKKNSAHAIAEIPREDTTEFFNSGYRPSDEESREYKISQESCNFQTLGSCLPNAALRLTQSELNNRQFMEKLIRTKYRKNISRVDAIPVYIWRNIDPERIEKTDEEQPDTFKEGGLIKKPANKKMRHQMTAVPLVEKSPRKLIGGEGGKRKQSLKDGGVVEKIKKGIKKARDVVVESAKTAGRVTKEAVKNVAKKVAKEAVKVAKAHSHKLPDLGKRIGKEIGVSIGRAGVTAIHPQTAREHPEAVEFGGEMVGRVGEHYGEKAGQRLHEKIQSLKKGGKVKKVKELTDAQKLKEFEKSEEKREKRAEALASGKGKLTNLAKNRERMLSVVTDTTPAKARKSRAKKAEVVIVEEIVAIKKPRAKKMKEGGEVKAPAKKSSAWLDHVKAHRAKHGGSYRDAMKNAKATYKK